MVDDANKMMGKVKELEESKDKKLAEDVAETAKSVKKQAMSLGNATYATYATYTDVSDVLKQCMKASSLVDGILNEKFDSASIQRCGRQNLIKNDPATAE